jgi:hypothetical protein
MEGGRTKMAIKRGWPKSEEYRKSQGGSGPTEYSNPADYDRYESGYAYGQLPDDEDEAPKKPRRKKPAELEKVRVTVVIEAELDRKMRYRMADDRVTMSDLVTSALEAYL